MEGNLISMKRKGERNEALVSPATALVSRHFTFRFMPSARCREQTSGAGFVRPFSLLFRREGGDDFFEARIAAERVPLGSKT